ncbi:hypothetical protein QJS66_07025 [Kocuria rhizophila]|nr:hypothetical protein QJS66_07025 [Kocuria rhizophila]
MPDAVPLYDRARSSPVLVRALAGIEQATSASCAADWRGSGGQTRCGAAPAAARRLVVDQIARLTDTRPWHCTTGTAATTGGRETSRSGERAGRACPAGMVQQ